MNTTVEAIKQQAAEYRADSFVLYCADSKPLDKSQFVAVRFRIGHIYKVLGLVDRPTPYMIPAGHGQMLSETNQAIRGIGATHFRVFTFDRRRSWVQTNSGRT
jgi:hypothetical protein